MELDFHRELKTAVGEFLRREAWTVHEECPLPNHKTADICATRTSGKILIVEIKTCLKHSLIAKAYEKYSTCCDVFYIAAPAAEIEKCAHSPQLIPWQSTADRAGLLSVTGRAVTITRPACPLTVHPITRTNLLYALQQRRSGR